MFRTNTDLQPATSEPLPLPKTQNGFMLNVALKCMQGGGGAEPGQGELSKKTLPASQVGFFSKVILLALASRPCKQLL